MSTNKVYFSYNPMYNRAQYIKKNKLHVYKTNLSVLSYGCEAWTITQSSEERKLLRRIFGLIYENDLG
jgi:hypothetical protein